MYWCFGSQRTEKRIGHAVVIPETTPTVSVHTQPESQTLSSSVVLPFIAPPSSPASFLQSEPPSVSHSPVGLFSLSALSAEVYSPGGPASMFAIGPYAHETQLVSPPVFSTLTTEPSTAPLTPPEPVHLTTPSSPEVPFAQLLMSSLDSNLKKGEGFGFQSYQLYHPGSPIGNLISPSSVCSGTSSPLPDLEFGSCTTGSFPAFPSCDPPKLVNAEELAMHRKIPQESSRRDGLLAREQIPLSKAVDNAIMSSCNGNVILNNRISFELAAKKLESFAEKEDPYRVSLDHHLKKAEMVAESHKPTDDSTDHSRSSSLTFDNRFLLESAAEQLESLVDNKDALFRVSSDQLDKTESASGSGILVKDDAMDVGPSHNGNSIMDNRRTFELAARKLECLVESREGDPYRVSLDHFNNRPEPAAEPKQAAGEAKKIVGCYVDESYHDLPGKLKRSFSDLGSKEFKFRDADGAPTEPTVGLEWWVKEKVTGTEMVGSKNWAFFPIVQPGVS